VFPQDDGISRRWWDEHPWHLHLLRRNPPKQHPPQHVGGYPFRIHPPLWREGFLRRRVNSPLTIRPKIGYRFQGIHLQFFRYTKTDKTTKLKNIKLMILNTRQTKSFETNPEGAINARHVQTPKAQDRLISLEDFRLIILTMRGIFQKGKMMAATRAIRCIITKNP